MSIKEEVEDVVEKGIEYSKFSLQKAYQAVSRFGDESVFRIEIKRLEKKLEVLKGELGQVVYSKFDDKKRKTINRSDPEISLLLAAIDDTRQEIESRRQELISEKNKK